jgi:regulation of enolase protein 1 (concanavalin A-like superfamily)
VVPVDGIIDQRQESSPASEVMAMSCRYWLLLACCPVAVSAAPVPKEDGAARLRTAYGDWLDPDKDCKYVLKGDELRISLPKSEHLPGGKEREGASINAPRVLREVEGDFTAVVRVAFPVPERVPDRFNPYCSGGLLAWESEKAYLVVRRAGGIVIGPGEGETLFCSHATPNSIEFSGQGLGKPAGSAFIRMRREGNKVVVGSSRDGKTWKELKPKDVAWNAKMKVGVIAENTLDMPVVITFDQYSLTRPKK